MRRGAKPGKAKVKARLPVARKAPKKEASGRREIEKRLAESVEREKATGELLQEKTRALTEALEQQTATSEILHVISNSPTDVRSVLDAVAESAARLCDSLDSGIFRVDGNMVRLVAHKGPIPAAGRATPPDSPLVRGTVNGRAIMERRTIQVADLQAETQEFPEGSARARQIGWRTQLSVPLLREGTVIGVISLRRTAVRPFTDTQISLLQTFADQAVIAIENVRLFTELQASNRELTTALDQQTATSDILRVISQSQTDVQPVFDAIVASAVRLLRAYTGVLTRLEGDQIVLAALTSTDDAAAAAHRALFPRSRQSVGALAQAIRDRAPLNIGNAHTDPRISEAGRAFARIRGYQSQVVVPLLHSDAVVGTISLTRRERGGFTDDEIALLQTFADQAVIAIENARLFTELEGRNRDLTATSEILRVISSSPTDLQPVFDAILDKATGLCDANLGALGRYDGERYEHLAHRGASPEFQTYLFSGPRVPGGGRRHWAA
ncbi:MAG TPA: GAF domain-containing protein [Methylomirabilota bacterium]|nr:GAF domain-containing protein [Methylomirabilota bacterium]